MTSPEIVTVVDPPSDELMVTELFVWVQVPKLGWGVVVTVPLSVSRNVVTPVNVPSDEATNTSLSISSL